MLGLTLCLMLAVMVSFGAVVALSATTVRAFLLRLGILSLWYVACFYFFVQAMFAAGGFN